MTQTLSPPTPRDLQVTWRQTRPDLVIQQLYGRGTYRNCYSETYYEVVSSCELDAADWKRLDEIGLLGMGQAYSVVKSETFTDEVPAIMIDTRTGEVTDVPPRNAYSGELVTGTYSYSYYRYTVRRICDSGD